MQELQVETGELQKTFLDFLLGYVKPWVEQPHTGQEQHQDLLDYEFKTKSTYGNIKGASLLDWPITLQDMEPYYTRAEDAIGSTHRGGRAALPANNNYKVLQKEQKE